MFLFFFGERPLNFQWPLNHSHGYIYILPCQDPHNMNFQLPDRLDSYGITLLVDSTLRQGYGGQTLWSYFIGLFVTAERFTKTHHAYIGDSLFVFVFTVLLQKNNKKKQQQSGCEILFQRLMPNFEMMMK